MTELHDHLASEIVEDHVDGLLSRREAMRRLVLLGVGVPAATVLLDVPALAAPSVVAQKKPPKAQSVEWDALPTEEVTFTGPNGTLLGSWAPAAEPRGGVLVIHEHRGLTDHIRSVVGRLAGSGYSALALDLP